MKKIAIMQPYLFPYIGYFQLINAVDQFVIYDDIQFIKGGWINRNNILINGRKTLITFPLSGASPNKKINEVDLQENLNKVEKTILMSYARAPYINEVKPILKKIFSNNDRNLARFTGSSLIETAKHIGLKTKLIYSSELDDNKQLHGQDRVINICKLLRADIYINAIGGRELYDKKEFKKNDLELKFVKTNFMEYTQLNNDFIPGLSIIDVLMFNSRKKINEMLNDYELV